MYHGIVSDSDADGIVSHSYVDDRVEESFTCSLALGEQAVQRDEQWVHDCLYGSSTTCPFEHDHGTIYTSAALVHIQMKKAWLEL